MSRAQFRDTVMLRGVSDLLKVPTAAQVAVYDVGTTTPIADTLYADDTSAITLPNPMTAQPDGVVTFWTASERQMDLVVTCNGYADTRATVMTDVAGQTGGLPIPLTQNLTFSPDGSFDIGVASANRPRNMYATGSINGALVDRGGQVYNVKAYGAVGDGVADDTAAIQAAIDTACAQATTYGHGARVYLPHGKYRITQTLNLFRADMTYVFMHFLGDGSGSTEIKWAGSTSGVAIKTSLFKQFKLSSFSLLNTVVAGTTIGLMLGNNAEGGTGTNNGIIESVSVAGFDTCVRCSDMSTGVASEITWINLSVATCSVGVLIPQFNALNHQFHNLMMNQCSSAGLKVSGGASVNVFGGASSGNFNDFNLATGGTFTITGFRAESLTDAWLVAGHTAPEPVTVTGCEITATSRADQIVVDLVGGGPFSFLNCHFNGGVQLSYSALYGQLELIGCVINDTVPFRSTADAGAGGDRGFRYRVARCTQGSGASGQTIVNTFKDEEGFWNNHIRYPVRSFSAPYNAGGVTSVHELRSMYGLSGTTTQAWNLRGSATFASAATVAVTFPTGVAEVQSLNLTGATSGTFVLEFNGPKTGSLAYNVDNTSIQNALRALGTIGAGGVVCSGGPLPGSPVTITFAGPRGGGAQPLITAPAYKNSIVGATPTVTRVTPGSGQPPEADATYYVALSGGANETFWVTGKTTTGFTLHSSNATSTATVDWILIR